MDMVDAANYFKANCPKCGINIEVPFELYDAMVECPDCKAQILALPIAAKSSGDAPKVQFPAGFAIRTRKAFAFSRHFILISIPLVSLLVWVILWWVFDRFGEQLLLWTGSTVTLLVIAFFATILLLWWVLWILFPVFVYFGMQRMEVILRQIEINTRRVPK